MRHLSLKIFCDPHWELICCSKWYPGTSEISTPPEIAVGTHFHAQTWHKNYPNIFNYCWRSLLVANSKFGLLTIRQYSATRKHLFPYPQGDRSGLRKPKKDKHQHTNHSYHQHLSPWARLNWSKNKTKLSFNQANKKRSGARLVDVIKHQPNKVFLSWYHH